MLPASLHPLVQDNSPFALGRAVVSGREQTVFRYGPDSLPEVYRKASRARDRPILLTDEAAITVQDLFGRAGSYAKLLAGRGISSGTRVALILGHDAEWIAAFIALTSLGATAVLTGDADPVRQAMTAGCNIAVTDRSQAGLDNIIRPKEQTGTKDPGPLAFSPCDPEQEACIVFTSGSSGEPKGVVLTHRGITTGLMNMMLAGAAAARSASSGAVRTGQWTIPTVLVRTPLHHVSGYMQLLLMLMTGGRIVRSRQDRICPLIARHQITSVTGISDEEITMLLNAAPAEELRSLRSIVVVGRPLSASLRRAIRERLPDLGLGTGYGLTETNGLVSAIGNAELAVRPHAVGPLLPTVECRITRPDGLDCEEGESGSIRLRGAMLMRGYCHGEELEDGWFITGDVGYLSGDGYLHILDKEDRFLHDGGQRVSCREIEDAAQVATGLSDIAAIPFREEGGENLMIVAVASADDLSRLRIILAQQFPAGIMERAKFVATNRLPRTASGKIAYARLRMESAA